MMGPQQEQSGGAGASSATPEEKKNSGEKGADASWFLRPNLGKDSLNFLTNLLVTFCGQMER